MFVSYVLLIFYFQQISTVSHDIMTYYGLNPVSKDMGIDITAWESIISSITYIIAAIFLLLADVKNKPGFLLPWLVLETIAILMLPYYLYLFTFHLNTALLLTIVLGFGIASLGILDKVNRFLMS